MHIRSAKLAALGATFMFLGLSTACKGPSSPDPPGGGQVFALDYELYRTTVAPVLTARGCDSRDCHGGGVRGTFELSPADAKNLSFDFEQASDQVWPYDPTHSPLLTKPLKEDGGLAPHSFEPFETTDDPDYQTIAAWIDAGEFQ